MSAFLVNYYKFIIIGAQNKQHKICPLPWVVLFYDIYGIWLKRY